MPDRAHALDIADDYDYDILSLGVEQVRHNFRRYGLLDDQVKFLVGGFKGILPTVPVERLSVLRLDGDMYESTNYFVHALYSKLSTGGFCIIDDYGVIAACKEAVMDYRRQHHVTDDIIDIDGWGACWRRNWLYDMMRGERPLIRVVR